MLRILKLAKQRPPPKGWLLGAALMSAYGPAVANAPDERGRWNLLLRNYFLHNDLRDRLGDDAQEKRDIDRLYIILEYPILGLL